MFWNGKLWTKAGPKAEVSQTSGSMSAVKGRTVGTVGG